MPHDPARSCDLFFPFEKTVMQPIQEQFIEFALEADVLRFGEFKTKAGRLSPYFFNAGLFNTGALLDRLGEFYAKTLLAARDAGRIEFDMIFGPAYKGIPLAASVAMNLSRLGCDVPWAFNRKEAKDHGEGGVMVGYKPQDGDDVVIVEDVVTAGTAVRESIELFKHVADVNIKALFVSVDRMERGTRECSTLDELRQDYGIQVFPIVTVREIISFLHNRPVDGKVYIDDEMKAKMEAYLEEYGAKG